MTDLPVFTVKETDIEALATAKGRVVVLVPEGGKLDVPARRVNRLTRGALKRFVESEAFAKLEEGGSADLAWPAGMEAEAVQVIRLAGARRWTPPAPLAVRSARPRRTARSW